MSLFRLKRVNELIKRELSAEIRKLLPVDHYGVVSVTEVEVGKDLKTATVYVSAIGVRNQTVNLMEALQKKRGPLQRALAHRVVMKYTPHLIFREDRGLEHGQHMVELLENLGKGQKT